ncbi:uncharacterized protein FTOL_05091 [Fusarium torulosum]|uniref:Uncharacterized protein n=1 Tax=Fusarium torulosum TaxID=33205 RepID=A0AAE8SGR2_9HYPO|nr:uncharacterized protein FTOL_05091 [Fusarium torulosum]
MRLTWATTLVALLLTSAPFIVADNIHYDKSTPCEVGYYGSNNIYRTSPDYYNKAKCINNYDYKAECNPASAVLPRSFIVKRPLRDHLAILALSQLSILLAIIA